MAARTTAQTYARRSGVFRVLGRPGAKRGRTTDEDRIIRLRVYAITPYRGGVSGLWDLGQQLGIRDPSGINLGFGICRPVRRTWD